MNDKHFLEKIEIAYNVYKQKFGQSDDIEKFVHWLYHQYGLTIPKK